MKKKSSSSKICVTAEELQRRTEGAKYLKYGDIIRIARVAEVTPTLVTAFTKGKRNSDRVNEVFNKFVADRKKRLNELLEQEL